MRKKLGETCGQCILNFGGGKCTCQAYQFLQSHTGAEDKSPARKPVLSTAGHPFLKAKILQNDLLV